MGVIRATPLASHAAVREVGKDIPARSPWRAAGQAVTSAHAPKHAIRAAINALQFVHRAEEFGQAEASFEAEIDWQLNRLRELWDGALQ